MFPTTFQPLAGTTLHWE